MFTIERQQEIVKILKDTKSASVTQLAKKLFIGEATIRRDLDKLQKQGLIKRTYGGAVWLEGLDSEIPLYIRENSNKYHKDAIGRVAAQLVNDGDIIIMDSSSSTFCMTKYLSHLKKLTVITNGAKTTIALGEFSNFDIYSTGGKLRKNSLSYIGDTAKKFINNIHADILFFSCRSFSVDAGLFDSSVEEAELRKVMIRNANKKILLCDSSKFDKGAFYKICDISVLDCIITNADASTQALNELDKTTIKYLKV